MSILFLVQHHNNCLWLIMISEAKHREVQPAHNQLSEDLRVTATNLKQSDRALLRSNLPMYL